MAVLVMGATGDMGRASVKALQDTNNEIIAGVHNEYKAKDLTAQGIEVRQIDLVKDSVDQIKDKLKGVDNIIFNAAENQSRSEMTLLVDLDGAAKMIEAAKQLGIKHFITVTADGVESRDKWSLYGPSYRTFCMAKYYQEQLLKASGIIYTIIRPNTLTNAPASNQISIHPGGYAISRNDIALAEVKALTDKRAFNKEFNIFSGNQTIDEVFDELN